MKRSGFPLGTLLVVLCLAGLDQGSHASIIATGSYGPGEPITWTDGIDGTDAWVGSSQYGLPASGMLTVDSGSDLLSARAMLGGVLGSTGVVSIDGPGSTWSNRGTMYVGRGGSGTLNITNGGAVNLYTYGMAYIGYEDGATGVVTVEGASSTFYSGAELYVGYSGGGTLNIRGGATVTADYETRVECYGGTGTIDFGPGGGTLTTGGLWASPSQLPGTGTVHARGLVSDVDLVLDSAASLTQTLTFNSLPGQNITLNLDLATDPDNNGALGVGYLGNGSLTIRNGTKVASFEGRVGYAPGSVGVANVEGSGTEWNLWSDLRVGSAGHGTLNIVDGAVVSSFGSRVGDSSGATGVVTVDGAGSAWLNDYSLYMGDGGDGTLNVTNGAMVTNRNYFAIGYRDGGRSRLHIAGGGTVTSNAPVHIATGPGTTGVATVDGPGSTWTIAEWLEVGNGGNGILTITNGGAVSTKWGASLAWRAGSEAVVTVDGTGSAWNNNDELEFGSGTGRLQITNGGVVTATDLSLGPNTLLAIDIGKGSHLDLGSGQFTNGGRVRLTTGADVPVGSYTPITAGTWSGTGVYEPIGGTWNTTEHKFIVSAPVQGTAGSPVTINDLATSQRILITDTQTGWSIGASFAPAAPSTALTLTASPITGDSLTSLESLLGPSQSLLAGWQFTASGGYTSGDPVYLSMDIGAGFSPASLLVWHDGGAGWDAFAATDLTYDGRYASFTVTGFSAYALSAAAVPEPATLVLLATGLAGVAFCMRRHSRSAMRGRQS